MTEPDPRADGYRTQSEDTERWAEEILFARWRSMTIPEKAALLTDLCRAEHELALAGLAYRFPSASRRELELRAACRRLGREVVERVLGEPLPFEG